jgi:hypothetical protein
LPDFFSAEIPAYFPDGFFWSKLILSEIFVLEDRLSFSKHGPYHRVSLGESGLYLTIPCQNAPGKPIFQVQMIQNSHWMKKHWETIKTHTNHLPYALYLQDELEPLFHEKRSNLSRFLFNTIQYLKYIWRIPTKLYVASEIFPEKLPYYYVDEWHQHFQFSYYIITQTEEKFVKKHSSGNAFQWVRLKVKDSDLKNDLHRDSLFLLFRYGTDFPGLVKKYVQLEEEFQV